MTTQPIKTKEYFTYNLPNGRIERRGAWFVAFDVQGTRMGAKMGLGAAKALLPAVTEVPEEEAIIEPFGSVCGEWNE